MVPSDTRCTAPPRAGFRERGRSAYPDADVPQRVATLMLNVGLRCDSACPHCHHACTPLRTESMSRETMAAALELARLLRPDLVDVTGGEPELWPHLRELIERARTAEHPVRVRTNLVALSRPHARDLPAYFAENGVRLLASLPGTTAEAMDAQRGAATWDTALSVLRDLNARGYGAAEGGVAPDGLRLDLAYNPPIGELPRAQSELEGEFRDALAVLGVRFDSLIAIGNVPVGRFREHLERRGTYDDYAEQLEAAFNPAVVGQLACRHGVEVAWDGTLWDCDFNLGGGVRPSAGPRTLDDVLASADPVAALATRRIGFARHCFACTAGAGTG